MRPTREGKFDGKAPGLITKGYGVDPGVVVEEPDPPVDRTSEGDAIAYVPFLPPPDLGAATDLNLQLGTDSDGGGIRPVTDPTNANDGNLTSIAGRASYFNGSGTDTWYLRADLGSAQQVDEIVIRGGKGNAGENEPFNSWQPQFSDDNSTWTNVTGSSVFDGGSNPRTTTWTLTGSPTHRYWRIGEDVPPGFTYPLKVHTWQLNGPQTVDPTEALWVEAPLSIDDDDATYNEVDEDSVDSTGNVFWRCTLADSYLIASLEAIIGFDTAGSVTVTVQAGNEEDYSDAATIGTVVVTATGSLTGDDVAASLPATDVYRYWQMLVDVADAVRVYEVALLDPVPPSGVHGDLSGRDAADQHPADAVTVVPFGSIAATNVQDALEEIVAEAGSTLTVDDGTTSVSPVDTIVFDGATVTDDGGGQATVTTGSAGAGAAQELDYVQITSAVDFTASAEASATTIITGNARTYDGSTTILIEAYFPYITLPNQNDVQLWLYDGSSSIGSLALMSVITATGITGTQRQHVRVARRLTPSAASHTYSIRGTRSSSGTASAGAGAGGSGNHMPAFMRITTATATPLNNFTATSNPTAGDDSADGYSAGSRWINTTTGSSWVCLVATTGAARWHALVNPLPDMSNHAGQFSSGTTSLGTTTAAFAVGSNLVLVVCSTSRKPNAAPSQTNVTWTERYASSGNSEFLTVYTGVVAGGAAGTTLTVTFASSTAVWVEVCQFDDHTGANFTAATAATTATVATTALLTIGVGGMTIGGIYMVGYVAAAPASSYGGASHAHMPGFTSFGGQGRFIVFRAQQDTFYAWSLASSGVNQFAAVLRLT